MDYYHVLERMTVEEREKLRSKLYNVLVSERVKRVIDTALKINCSKIQKYYPLEKIKENDWIPIDVIDKVCEINKKNSLLPLHFSELWFCLDGQTIKRTLPSGKIIQGKVSFYSTYLNHDDMLLEVLHKSIDIVGSQKEFGDLIERTQIAISRSLLKKSKLSLTSIIKACQILNKDYWKLLENKMLYSHRGDSILFKNNMTKDMVYLIEAINQEGHLNFGDTSISIKQNNKEYLETIEKILSTEFSVPIEKFILRKEKDRWENFKLLFSSASLRQFLCLKFRIALGYKCPIVTPLRLQEKELAYPQVSSLLETDGSFTGCVESYGFITPNFYFGSSSRLNVLGVADILKTLNFGANVYKDRICIQRIDEAVKLMFEILPYMKHRRKIENGFKILSQKDYIMRLRVDNSDKIKELVKEARILINRRTWGSGKKLIKYLANGSKGFNLDVDLNVNHIYHWLEKTNPPLLMIILLCKLLNKDYFSYIPNYYGLVLFLNGLVTLDKLEELRGEPLENLRNFSN